MATGSLSNPATYSTVVPTAACFRNRNTSVLFLSIFIGERPIGTGAVNRDTVFTLTTIKYLHRIPRDSNSKFGRRVNVEKKPSCC